MFTCFGRISDCFLVDLVHLFAQSEVEPASLIDGPGEHNHRTPLVTRRLA